MPETSGQLPLLSRSSSEPSEKKIVNGDWAATARSVIARLPDESLRCLLIDSFEETAATLEYQQGLPRQAAEQNAFGLLLFQILRRGIDVEVDHAQGKD